MNIVSCCLRILRDPSHWLKNLQVVLVISRLPPDRLHCENTGSISNNLLGGVVLDSKKNTLLPPWLELVASLEKLNCLSKWWNRNSPLATSVSGVRCLTILHFSRSVKQIVQCSCMFNQPCQDHTIISNLHTIRGLQCTSECPGLTFNSLHCSFDLSFAFRDSYRDFLQNQLTLKSILSSFNNCLQCWFWIIPNNHLWVSQLPQIIQKTFGSNWAFLNSFVR